MGRVMEIYKTYKHNPPHLFRSNAKYFITSSSLGKYPYFRSDAAKEALLLYLTKSLTHFAWTLEEWVILDNHIHIMAEAPENAETLSLLMNNFHKFTANWLSRNGIKKFREKYFHNYWDTCINYEKSYYTTIHYIWHNPVKHGYVESPEDWKFGSYYFRLQENENEVQRIKETYPFDKIKLEDKF
jgi:putative transposase